MSSICMVIPKSYYIIMGGGLKGNDDNWGKADVNIFIICVRLTDRYLFVVCVMCKELHPWIWFLQLRESARHIFKTRPGCGFLQSMQKQNEMETMRAEWDGYHARIITRRIYAHNNKVIMCIITRRLCLHSA